MEKSRALARYSKFRKHASSTDRLRRVQDIKRYVKNDSLNEHIGGGSLSDPPTDETEVLVISDPITTLLYSEKRFWICIGEVNDIKIDGDFADSVPIEMLDEDTVTVSYQMLGTIEERSFTVPGRFIQVVNPTLSKTHTNIPFYLKSVPKIAPRREYPYREASGTWITLNLITILTVEDHGASICPRCSPAVTLDLSQGQRVLEHIGAHILHDPGITQSTELCGLCLREPPFCEFFLAKGKGANRSSVAAESTPSSPCSNVPITCPLCSKTAPAVWKYFLKAHFQEAHKSAQLSMYEHLWKLSNFETAKSRKCHL